MGEKKKLKLTTLPRMFAHAVCHSHSIVFAIQRFVAGASFRSRGSGSASCVPTRGHRYYSCSASCRCIPMREYFQAHSTGLPRDPSGVDSSVGCCCCSHTNSHNQVRGHRTGSSHSGAEENPREKHKQPKVVHAYITADAIHASTRNI